MAKLEIIEFSASWCTPCKMVAPTVKELQKKYEGKIAVTYFDAEEQEAEAKALGIRNVPTFVFMKDGEEVGRKSGGMSRKQLEKEFETFYETNK